MENKNLAVSVSILLLLFFSACITQQETIPGTDNEPVNQTPEPAGPTTPTNNPPIFEIPTPTGSGEFTLKTGESVKNLRGMGIYDGQKIELRVKSVIYRHFPASKIAVFEALDESGAIITQKDARTGRYLNEDIVSEDAHEPILLDKVYVKGVVVSEEGNTVTIEVNK